MIFSISLFIQENILILLLFIDGAPSVIWYVFQVFVFI